MSRNHGIINYASNFEVLAQAPLDARMLVGYYTDLVDPSVWKDSNGLVWLFDGALVVVSNDPSSGIYWLKDAANYTDYNSWEQAGVATPFDPSTIYSYIDGSLALRDLSINDLYSRITIADSSIDYLIKWNTSLDASIVRIDGSLNIIFDRINTIDSSIAYLDSSIKQLFSRSDSSVLGAINIGDGSVGIFKSIDASGNIQLKSIKGAGAAIISEIADTIIVSLDASFAGEINYGQNVGLGDASIYVQKAGDALQFREIKGAGQILVSVSDNLILIDASIAPSPGGEGVDGGVWITNITPTGSGNVGDKVTSSDGVVLDSCLTDTSMLTVAILALPGHTNYKPNVYIDSSLVTLTASVDKPVFTGTKTLSYNFADASITVVHEDGAHWSTIVDADTPAVILSANFIGTYPGSQTELKAGDTMQINVVTDVPVTQIAWDNSGALTAGTYTASGTNNTFTVTIADRGTSAVLRGFTLRATKSTGSTSLDYISTVHGSVELTDVVRCNNLYPTATFGTITYPVSQGAIKSGESATVVNTLANYDSVVYSSPNGELTVTSPTTAQTPKTVTYLAGTYNIGTNNLRVIATRNANNTTTTANTSVWIANTPATLSISHAPGFSSGGNDGTLVQNHQVSITSSQRLLSYPTLVKGAGGTWVNTNFSWSSAATLFTNNLSVNDNMTKGTYSWGAISGTNLAGVITTTNLGTTQYVLKGFVVRTLTLPAFGWQVNMNVAVYDYSKLSSSGTGQILNWTVPQNTRSALGDVTRPQASTWSASATGTNPTTINILDKSATDSQSQATTFTIQEGV